MNNSTSLLEGIVLVNTVSYFYIMPVLLITGIATNMLNMYVLWDLNKIKDKRAHKASATTYMYLNWLAFAQLLSCLVIIPSLLNLYRSSLSYKWAYYFAHFEILFVNSFTTTCVYLVVGLSLDRYVAVCRPHSYQILRRVRLASIRIAIAFFLPPILYIPLCFFQQVKLNDEESGYTPVTNEDIAENSFWKGWNVAVQLFNRLIPAVVIVILNSCIIYKFHNVRNTLKPRSGPDHDMRMFVLLISVIMVFLICTLPAAILGLTDTFGHHYKSLSFEV